MNNYQETMKDSEVIYLNGDHEKIVDKHIKGVKELMYYATEKVGTGKYQDFLTIMNSIYMYSNNFYNTVLKKGECDEGEMAEFIFLIPNMSFYTSIGFLTALKDGENDLMLRDKLERIGLNCENTTAELADVLFEENEKKKFFNDAFNKRISKN
jgi:hypothetical protein